MEKILTGYVSNPLLKSIHMRVSKTWSSSFVIINLLLSVPWLLNVGNKIQELIWYVFRPLFFTEKWTCALMENSMGSITATTCHSHIFLLQSSCLRQMRNCFNFFIFLFCLLLTVVQPEPFIFLPVIFSKYSNQTLWLHLMLIIYFLP